MKMIGITGRSGCGKSTVCNVIRSAGYTVADADVIAREVLEPGSPCLPLLQEAFGRDILDEAGTLRRRLLADRAFATPEGTKKLTALTYPEIERRILTMRDALAQKGERLFFVDGAVIVGTPMQARCNRLVVVEAPYEVSVERICARDSIGADMARRRLDAQLSPETLRAAATDILPNDADTDTLRQRTKQLLQVWEKGAL